MLEFFNLTWVRIVLVVLACLVTSTVMTAALTSLVRLADRRVAWPRVLSRRSKRPFRLAMFMVPLWFGFSTLVPYNSFDNALHHAFSIAAIASLGWLVSGLVLFAEDMLLERFPTDAPENSTARRVHTQTQVIRRTTVVLVIVCAAGFILRTFPSARTAGTSFLASAGIASVIAGLAAQATLGNMFAGIQIALTDTLRLDDVVVVDNEWGRIEEITLTYIVLRLWDERRLVVPSSYFTKTPFQNWTRRGSQLLGSVEFDVDWGINTHEMREHLERILRETDLWDERVAILQVTDATGGLIRIRILVTATDAANLFNLRCFVRERMVDWLNSCASNGLPSRRLDIRTRELPTSQQ